MATASPDDIDRIIDVATGVEDAEPADLENRRTRRAELDTPMALVQWTPGGGKSISTIVTGKNISSTGLCVLSRYMLHVGQEGVILMLRSNGEAVMLGVKAVHSSYVGDMKHESGLTFIPAPKGFTIDDFRDEQGHLPEFLGQNKAA